MEHNLGTEADTSTLLDRFVLERRIGAGGMGVVYEAFDRVLGTRVALKTLHRLDGESLYRFKREFRLAQDLEHPNLVRLGELVCDRDSCFFTMEFIDGHDFLTYVRGAEARADGRRSDEDRTSRKDLRVRSDGESSDTFSALPTRRCMVDREPGDHSDRPKPEERTGVRATDLFDETRLRWALAGLASGIWELHRAGKVHRDIKPSNVLVTHEGRVVVLDFGIVAQVNEHDAWERDDSGRHYILGTASYMAPEQAREDQITPAADWYGFGVVLFQVLTGRLPYRGTFSQVLRDKQRFDPPTPSSLVSDVPEDLDELCSQLLRRDPAARLSGTQVLERLGLDERASPSSPSASDPSRPRPFVGREAELATLSEALEVTRSGDPSMVLVYGESGVGKSELVRHWCRQETLHQPGVIVWSGRCYPRESVPFNAFDGIADGLSRYLTELSPEDAVELLPPNADLLPQLFPVLGRVSAIAKVPRNGAREDRQQMRARRFAALRELFVRLAVRRPVVLVIDDLQWADDDSLALLGDLLHPPAAPPLLLIATVRPSDPSADVGALLEPFERLLGDVGPKSGAMRRVSLGRLAPESAMELAARLVREAGGDSREIDAIVRESEGHPMFLQELVHHLGEEGLETTVATVPTALCLDDALWARVTRLPEGARGTLELLCVAGAPVSRVILRHASDVSPLDFERSIALLRAASLIREDGHDGDLRLEPVHARVTEAVMTRLDEAVRRRHHRVLARGLERAGRGADDPQALVRHLAGAGEAQRAAQYAEQAAERADRALALSQAAHLYRVALELGTFDEDHQRSLYLRLGNVLANDGRGAQSSEAMLEAAKGAEPAVHRECRRRAAEQLLTSGHLEAGLEVTRALLRDLDVPFPETPRQALWSFVKSRTRLRLRGLRWRARTPAEIDQSQLVDVDICKSVADGLTLIDPVRGADFQTRGLILALRSGELRRIARALALETAFLGASGTRRSLARARRLVDQVADLAKQEREPFLELWALAAAATTAYFSCEFREAADRLVIVEERLRQVGLQELRSHDFGLPARGWELSSARIMHLWAVRQCGAMKELRTHFAHYLRDARQRGDRYAETTMLRSCTPVYLADDDPEEAERVVAESTWQPLDECRYHVQHFMALRARLMHELYRGDATGALQRLAPDIRRHERSLLNRFPTLRMEVQSLVGRLETLAATESSDPRSLLRRARRRTRACSRDVLPIGKLFGLQVSAAIAQVQRDPDESRRLLEALARRAADEKLVWVEAAARHRWGRLIAGDEGARAIARSEQWAREQGIVDLDRFFEVVCPWPSRARA